MAWQHCTSSLLKGRIIGVKACQGSNVHGNCVLNQNEKISHKWLLRSSVWWTFSKAKCCATRIKRLVVCYCLVSVFPSLIQQSCRMQYIPLHAVFGPLFCGWTQCCSLAVRNCPQRKGRACFIWMIPCWVFTGHLLCSCHGRNVLHEHVHLEKAGAASTFLPCKSGKKIGIKGIKKCVVHKIEIAYPEIQG